MSYRDTNFSKDNLHPGNQDNFHSSLRNQWLIFDGRAREKLKCEGFVFSFVINLFTYCGLFIKIFLRHHCFQLFKKAITHHQNEETSTQKHSLWIVMLSRCVMGEAAHTGKNVGSVSASWERAQQICTLCHWLSQQTLVWCVLCVRTHHGDLGYNSEQTPEVATLATAPEQC